MTLNQQRLRALYRRNLTIKGYTVMKSLFSGMAVAVVSGMLMGAAMKPELDLGDRPAGPQMFAGWSGARSTGPFDDGATFASFTGSVPDYVIGTDWQKPMASQDSHQDADVAPMEVAAVEPEATPQPVTYTAPTYEEPRPEPVTYPSVSGGIAYGAAPQAPTAPVADTPAEAPAASSLG